MRTKTALLLTITTSMLAWSTRAGARPLTMTLAFPDGANGLSPDEASELAYLWDHDCRVLTPSPLEQSALVAAAERIGEALSDPRVRTMLAEKADWMVESSQGAFAASANGQGILAALDELTDGTRSVSVFSWDATPDRPCRAPVLGGPVNASTQIGVPVLLFQRSYLEGLTHAQDHEAGQRRLARTLAHELAHVLGHTHHDGSAAIGSAEYNNTVPAFLGCVAMSWPDVDFAAAHCGEADEQRPLMPWTWSCDRRASAGRQKLEQAVEVRFGQGWLPGRVVAIDAELGNVRVDLDLSESEPAWVDACRIR